MHNTHHCPTCYQDYLNCICHKKQCYTCNNNHTACTCKSNTCPPLANLQLAEQVVKIITENNLLEQIAVGSLFKIPTVLVENGIPVIDVLSEGSVVLGADNTFYKSLNGEWVRFGIIYPDRAALVFFTTLTDENDVNAQFPAGSLVINPITVQIFKVD
jgi:hypothetical protein